MSLLVPAALVGLLIGGLAINESETAGCARPETWQVPGGEPADLASMLNGSLRPVLLGERHDSVADHQWQLSVLQSLVSRGESVVLALEMFPRSAQSVLDAWSAGNMRDEDFLEQVQWRKVWNFPPDPYLAVFRYAREHDIPLRAINVERGLIRRIAREGAAAIPQDELGPAASPAAPDGAYLALLGNLHAEHGHGTPLNHFVDAQLAWDRAMAHGIVDASIEFPQSRVVALVGAGHLRHRHGIPAQLASLGLGDAIVFLTDEGGEDCSGAQPGIADAVYGLSR